MTPIPSVFGFMVMRSFVVVMGSKLVVLYWFSSMPRPLTFGTSYHLPSSARYSSLASFGAKLPSVK